MRSKKYYYTAKTTTYREIVGEGENTPKLNFMNKTTGILGTLLILFFLSSCGPSEEEMTARNVRRSFDSLEIKTMRDSYNEMRQIVNNDKDSIEILPHGKILSARINNFIDPRSVFPTQCLGFLNIPRANGKQNVAVYEVTISGISYLAWDNGHGIQMIKQTIN